MVAIIQDAETRNGDGKLPFTTLNSYPKRLDYHFAAIYDGNLHPVSTIAERNYHIISFPSEKMQHSPLMVTT